MFAENTTVFLRDFGVPCTANGSSFAGLLDTPDQTLNVGGLGVISTMYALTVRTPDATAASIANGTAVTVAGVVYVVRDVLLQDDGAFTVLTLSR